MTENQKQTENFIKALSGVLRAFGRDINIEKYDELRIFTKSGSVFGNNYLNPGNVEIGNVKQITINKEVIK